MSIEAIPANNTYQLANTFGKQHRLDGVLAVTPAMEDHARTIVYHRAPDVYSMIFGGQR